MSHLLAMLAMEARMVETLESTVVAMVPSEMAASIEAIDSSIDAMDFSTDLVELSGSVLASSSRLKARRHEVHQGACAVESFPAKTEH